MGIQNFPAALVPAIQQGMLATEFGTGLESQLTYRDCADREIFKANIGETLTKTRKGLKAPVTTPLNPSTNTNLDNGLTPSGWTIEQYVLSINMYGDTMDLNMVTSGVGIASQFLANAHTNGVQANQSLDRLARNAIFGAYLSGNTRVLTTLGAPATTVHVDDIRGFQTAFSNGVQVPVSSSFPLTVTVGADVYICSGAVADGSNVSTAPNGVSGTLTFTTNVTVLDGTANQPVIAAVGSSIYRPNNRATPAALVAGDTLTIAVVLQAVATLRSNKVPTIRGLYNAYIDDRQLLGLFADPAFQLLYRGQYGSEAYKQGQIIEMVGVRFIPTTESPQQNSLGAGTIHRCLVVGQGALIEGDYEDTAYSNVPQAAGLIEVINGVAMVTREPLDRLQQIIAQSWYWIGGFCVPTDITANTAIIPTATNAYFKRGVIVESL
jgi:hypothetical protein